MVYVHNLYIKYLAFVLYIIILATGSKSMRLFTEGEVEEEINHADHLEKPEQVEDPVTVVCPDVAKKPSLTPGEF